VALDCKEEEDPVKHQRASGRPDSARPTSVSSGRTLMDEPSFAGVCQVREREVSDEEMLNDVSVNRGFQQSWCEHAARR